MKETTKEKLHGFKQKKSRLAVQLIIIGILGIFLPLIPGILLIIFGVSLVFPKILNKLGINDK